MTIKFKHFGPSALKITSRAYTGLHLAIARLHPVLLHFVPSELISSSQANHKYCSSEKTKCLCVFTDAHIVLHISGILIAQFIVLYLLVSILSVRFMC
jgi:hypothetical protein